MAGYSLVVGITSFTSDFYFLGHIISDITYSTVSYPRIVAYCVKCIDGLFKYDASNTLNYRLALTADW